MQEGKAYFSGDHKLYGYKVEVSVLPNGLAAHASRHYPGSVSDVDIFYRQGNFHREYTEKKSGEDNIADDGILCEEYPDNWVILVDKGYQGGQEYLRVVLPKKKPANRMTP